MRASSFILGLVLSHGLALDKSATAQAEEQLAPSGTNLHGTDGTETSDTILSFDCAFAREGQPRAINQNKITCRFATTGIARPTARQLADRLSEMNDPDHLKEFQNDFPAFCKQMLSEKAATAGAAAVGARRTQYDKLAKACRDKDVGAAMDAFRFGIREIWANTCKVFNYGSREYEFRRVDDSTWRGMDTTPVDGSATMKTIWRAKTGEHFRPWNYKQVTSADPRCEPSSFRSCSTDGSDEWTWDGRSKLVGCIYFD